MDIPSGGEHVQGHAPRRHALWADRHRRILPGSRYVPRLRHQTARRPPRRDPVQPGAAPHGLLGRLIGRIWVTETAAVNDTALDLLTRSPTNTSTPDSPTSTSTGHPTPAGPSSGSAPTPRPDSFPNWAW
jgi:hypothetical protein